MTSAYVNTTLIRETVETSRSLQEAADRLGLSKTYVRERATEIGVRSMFRYGVEKLPADADLVPLIRDARNGRGRQSLARSLHVRPEVLADAADELGLDCRYVVRSGLPNEATLQRDLLTCDSVAELARQYGVAEHMVRNQLRRLGIPAPTKRALRSEIRENRAA